MQRVTGFLQAQRVDLSIHEKTVTGIRNEAALQFTAALLTNPNSQLPKERLVEVAIEYADELVRQLKK